MTHPALSGRGLLRRGMIAALLTVGLSASTGTAAYQAAASPAAAVCQPAGHGPGTVPAIVFGRKGGNIRPMRVTIYPDGTITYVGGMPAAPGYTIRPDAVTGLQRLAKAEGFSTWPSTIKGTRLMPDSATLYITVRAGCSTATKTVSLQPSASSPSFIELFDTLTAASGLQQ